MARTIAFLQDSDLSGWASLPKARYHDYDLNDDDERNGVDTKQLLTDPEGRAYLIKSGAYGETPNHERKPLPPEEEQSRRLAFPIHEAISSLLYDSVGVTVGKVSLAFRTFDRVGSTGERNVRLLASIVEMRPARLRKNIENLAPCGTYSVDFFCMLVLDKILGQHDRPNHNYMITPNGTLLAIDNAACMHGEWWSEALQPDAFEFLHAHDQDDAADIASEHTKRAAAERTSSLTSAVVDEAFLALPTRASNYHEENFVVGYYTPASLDKKKQRIKENLCALREWERRRLFSGFQPSA